MSVKADNSIQHWPAHLCVEVQVEVQLAILFYEIYLGQQVDVGKLQVQHGGQGQQQCTDVLCWVTAQVGIHQVHCSKPVGA